MTLTVYIRSLSSPATLSGAQQEWKDTKPVLLLDTAFLAWGCFYKLVGKNNLHKSFLK